ncbi:uncharacterized protein [Miscanthus floridulus]|uniref:uncharacterized protein n=1 Tax=Miscanthus floridulus TaxID=154761 RepID=UPI003458D050
MRPHSPAWMMYLDAQHTNMVGLSSRIKFPCSPSSSEDKLPSHKSSEENSDNRMSDYSPPWSFEKENPDEEDEDNEDEDDANTDAEDDDDDSDDDSDDSDSDSDFASPPPMRARQAGSYLD